VEVKLMGKVMAKAILFMHFISMRLKIEKKKHFFDSTTYLPAIADHVKTTGHNIKWNHFDILASGKTDYHCKIKETWLIHDRFTVKIVFLIMVPDPLSLLYKRFVKIVTVTFENVC